MGAWGGIPPLPPPSWISMVLPVNCKLCREAEMLLHLWEECPALALEQTQYMVPGGGRIKPLHHLFLNIFHHEKGRGLMCVNSV